jgi:hypothetical protein
MYPPFSIFVSFRGRASLDRLCLVFLEMDGNILFLIVGIHILAWAFPLHFLYINFSHPRVLQLFT